jgi:hypothetical protein
VAPSDLPGQARAFANKIQTLLNKTVADHARVTAAVAGQSLVAVGTNLLTRELTTSAVPLLSTVKQHRCYLDVQFRLYLENEGHYLTVESSFFGVYSSLDAPDPLFHYDFERGKDGYTEAHLQVFGENHALTSMMLAVCTRRKKKQLGELHFPVGGRRFRPALEDVLEFLIDEQLVEPKDGWQDELERCRAEFRDIQLRAAIRRYPELAREVLSKLDAAKRP